MAKRRCKSCLGEYDDIGPDGVRYFHACPPLTRVHVERAAVEQDVPLATVLPTDFLFVDRAGVLTKVLPANLLATDRRAGDTAVERADKRDENVKIIAYDKAGNAITGPKSEGKGVEPAPAK